MTYRERRLARADRLDEWAAKRAAKSQAGFDQARSIADMIPLGQPILAGHHSQRRAERDQERIVRGMVQGHENAKTASGMADRAATIRAQADRAIYDDDPDAIERLRERIAGWRPSATG